MGPVHPAFELLLHALCILALILLIPLTSCKTLPRVIDPITFPPVPEYSPATVQDLVGTTPVVMLPPERIEVAEGEAAPWAGILIRSEQHLAPFKGYLIAEADWLALVQGYGARVADAEDFRQLVLSTQAAAKAEDSAKIRAILVCREAKRDAFFAGVGIGAGSCAVVYGALDRLPVVTP